MDLRDPFSLSQRTRGEDTFNSAKRRRAELVGDASVSTESVAAGFLSTFKDKHLSSGSCGKRPAAPVPVRQRPWGQKWPGAGGCSPSSPSHTRREPAERVPGGKGFPLPSSSSRRPPQQLAPVARPWGFAMSSRADGCWKAGTAGHTLLRVPVTSGSGVPALVFAHRKGMQKAAPSLQSCAPRPSPSTGHGSSAGPERCLSRVLATAGGTGQPGGQGWPPALPLALPLAGSTLIHAYMRLYILIDADRPLWRLLLLLLP